MIYETRLDPPLPRARFLLRLAGHGLVGLLLVAASLGIGIAGYEHFEGLPWRDAFLNSAMLLGGMGPVDGPKTDAGKVFAGVYALYCGLVVIISVSVVLAPVVHRAIHLFHWKKEDR